MELNTSSATPGKALRASMIDLAARPAITSDTKDAGEGRKEGGCAECF
jgi:hypothetical protein